MPNALYNSAVFSHLSREGSFGLWSGPLVYPNGPTDSIDASSGPSWMQGLQHKVLPASQYTRLVDCQSADAIS